MSDRNINTSKPDVVDPSNSTNLDYFAVIFNIKRGMQEGQKINFLVIFGKTKLIFFNFLQTWFYRSSGTRIDGFIPDNHSQRVLSAVQNKARKG